MKRKRLFGTIASLLLLCSAIFLANRLIVPKYMTSSREGALIGEYYREIDEGRRHEVIFIGDCEAYESFIPAIIWEESGITSYVRGSPAQSIAQSYFLLEEMLRLDSPKVVVLSVYAMNYSRAKSEVYNRMTLDGMRWSKSKIAAIRASMTEGESFLSYLLPLLRFHDRWSEISREDIRYFWKRDTVSHNGYLMQTGILPEGENQPLDEHPDHDLPAISFEYLGKMKALCDEVGVELVLIKAPTNSWRYFWYDEWEDQIREFCDGQGISYYNLINEEIGIDPLRDSYDGGLHLNVYGAEKTSRFFAQLLRECYFIGKAESEGTEAEIWRKKIAEYYNEKNKKNGEINNEGKIFWR